MNGHELWRLRELGIGGPQVQTQESNFWSKYNCPVLQWTGEYPRHGFVSPDTAGGSRNSDRARRERITLPAFLRDSSANATSPASETTTGRHSGRGSSRARAPSPTMEPPVKQSRLESPRRPDSATTSANTSIESSSQPGSNTPKGNWYFVSSSESLRESCASVFPQFAQEHHIDLGHSNKIFAARWLSDDRIVMGTKCNSILVMNAANRKPKYRRPQASTRYEDEDEDEGQTASEVSGQGRYSSPPLMKIQPLKSSGDSLQIEQNCGIHAIDVNPSGTLFASGGDNPADVSVFRLPNFEPLTVGESAHSDWLFDLEWLDDEYLVSGSRDSTLALWRFPNNQDDMIVCSHSNRLVKSCDSGPLSGGRVGGANHHHGSQPCSYYGCLSYPSSRPIEVKKLQRFDKVRALTFNNRRAALTSVSLNSYLHVLDINTFKQRLLKRIDGYTECVCLCNSPDEDLLTIGSRTSFAFFDTRTWDRVGDEKLPRRNDEDPHSLQSMMPSGVRSVSWHGHMLTLGTGGGEIMFYDVRARKFLQCDCNRSLTLKITGGWLHQDEVYQEIFLNLPCPNAVYAHCYDENGTRLFAAGGPIAASLVGNYASMWE